MFNNWGEGLLVIHSVFLHIAFGYQPGLVSFSSVLVGWFDLKNPSVVNRDAPWRKRSQYPRLVLDERVVFFFDG